MSSSLTQEQIDEFWSIATEDKKDSLTIQELDKGLRGYCPPGKGPSSKDVAAMFFAVDTDGDKKITKQEFETEMLQPPRRKTLKATFCKFDTDNSNCLSKEELRNVVEDSGCFKGQDFDAVTDDIMANADANKNGTVDFEEFIKVVS